MFALSVIEVLLIGAASGRADTSGPGPAVPAVRMGDRGGGSASGGAGRIVPSYPVEVTCKNP